MKIKKIILLGARNSAIKDISVLLFIALILPAFLSGCDDGICRFTTITTKTLPDAPLNQVYNKKIETNGVCFVTFQSYYINGGTLPPGVSLDSNGNISGTPNTIGSYSFTISVRKCYSRDAWGFYDCNSSSRGYAINVR